MMNRQPERVSPQSRPMEYSRPQSQPMNNGGGRNYSAPMHNGGMRSAPRGR
jgi:hypothetical protein